MSSMRSGQNSSLLYLLKGKTFLVFLFLMTMAFFAPMVATNAGAVCAPTFEVTTVGDLDDGTCDAADCSLREAIAAANASGCPGNTITFKPGVGGTIHLGSELLIDNDTEIVGPTAKQIVISGDEASRVFYVGSSGCPSVSVSNLSIADGSSDNGGGIFLECGNLSISNSTFFNNAATGYGGAIYNADNLIVVNSTFANNSAGTDGGSIYTDPDAVQFDMFNTIIAGTSGFECADDAGVLSQGSNLIEDNSCSPDFSGDPKLGTLTGSPDPAYYPLMSDSPALNTGDDTVCSDPPVNGLDQLNATRPFGTQCDIGAVEQYVPATNATLIASSPSPQVAAGLTFTASATCPAGSCEYKWMKYNYTSLSWTTIYDYPADHGDSLSGTDVGVGNWAVRVVVRNIGSPSSYGESQAQMNYSIVTNTPASGGYIGTTKPSPNTAAGLQIWGGATSAAPFEQQFMLYTKATNSWTILQDYPSQNAVINAPALAPGSYSFRVYLRNVGSLAAYETFAQMDFEILANPPAQAASLTANRTSPQAANATTLTGTATGGTGDYEYMFVVANPVAARMTICDWSGTNTCSLASVPAGTYKFRLWVRNVGTTVGETYIDLSNYTVTGPVTGATLIANHPSGEGVNGAVFTAGGVGGLGTYEYHFERSTNGTDWTVMQDFPSTNNVFAATSVPPSTYTFRVKVKNRYAPGTGEATADLGPYTLVGPATNATLSANFGSPHVAAGLILDAGASGGKGSYEYKFMLFNGTTWSTLQDYPSANHLYDASAIAPGNYTFRVMIRNTDSTAGHETFKDLIFTILADPPASDGNLLANFASPHETAGLTFTASATCGAGGCEYKFLKFNKNTSTWSLIKDYPNTNPVLTGAEVGAGNYTLRVLIRNAGSVAAAETSKNLDYLVTNEPFATGADISPNFASPHVAAGLTFTASAACGAGGCEYKFMRWNGTTWTTLQDFPNTNTTFDASGYAPGTYTFRLDARNVGSPAPYESRIQINYTISP